MSNKTDPKLSLWMKFCLGLITLGVIVIAAMAIIPRPVLRKIVVTFIGPSVPTSVIVSNGSAVTLNKTKTFDALIRNLESFRDDPAIGDVAREIIERQADYRAFLEKNLIKLPGARIDLAGQAHANDFGGPMFDRQIVESQRKIKEFLDSHSFDCVGDEGMSAARFDNASLDREFYEMFSRKRRSKEKAFMEQKGVDFTSFETFVASPLIKSQGSSSSSERFKNDAVALYSLERPDAVFGVEDILLLELHHTILSELARAGRAADPRIQRMAESLAPLASRIRLEFAYAKMVERMRRQNGKRGVIVFGYGHIDQFRELIQGLGGKARIYDFSGEKK